MDREANLDGANLKSPSSPKRPRAVEKAFQSFHPGILRYSDGVHRRNADR